MGEASPGAGNAVGGASTGDPPGRAGTGAGTASPNPVPATGSAVAAAPRWVRKYTIAPSTSAPAAIRTIIRSGELDDGIALATARMSVF
jgi:hypothetical protein